jgi:hypothetical protein
MDEFVPFDEYKRTMWAAVAPGPEPKRTCEAPMHDLSRLKAPPHRSAAGPGPEAKRRDHMSCSGSHDCVLPCAAGPVSVLESRSMR